MNNLKKVISSAAAVAMLASTASAFAASFPDVDKSANYASAVNVLTGLNIVNGDDAGKFNPDNTVTRAEFAKMVVEAIGEGATAEATTTTQFADSASHWGAGYIQTGVNNGFINGYDENTFGPDDTVTYAQAVKMLVAAIGYTKFAEIQGGYPGGYLNYGSQTKIISGVSGVSNDTAITRAQCAMLVANALKAPMCIQNGGEYISGGEFVPKYQIQDGKEYRDYESLLTEKHNAYYVKGRVSATAKDGSVDKDEVKYDVESADNWDGDTYTNTSGVIETGVTVKINGTNADSMQFEYSEAIIQKDEDTEEYSFVSIDQYGANKTVSFAAEDVDDTDDMYSPDLSGTGITNYKPRMAVKKNSTSSATTKYELATDVASTSVDESVKLYVNGKEVVSKDLATYVIGNPTGTVTLIDKTLPGTTSTDGKYDYIVVDYTQDAMVSSIEAKEDRIRINLKETDMRAGKVEYDPTDDKIDVKYFNAEGKEIAYTDIKENDVLSIAYDVTGGASSFANSEYYMIHVSDSTVSGMVSSVDSIENEITVDGTTYKLARGNAGDYEFNTEYTLYLDKFGYVAANEEGESSKNYGVLVSTFLKAGDTNKTARVITADGTAKDYEIHSGFVSAVEALTAASITVDNAADRVVNYTLSGGKLKLKEVNSSATGNQKYVFAPTSSTNDLTFRESSSKLGNAEIADGTTKILDLNGYIEDDDSNAAACTVASFTDDTSYKAWTFDKNNDGIARFVIVTDGLANINADTKMAVVASAPASTQIDGDNYWTMKVVVGGVEETINVPEGEYPLTPVNRGDVVIYATKGSDSTDLKLVKSVGNTNYKTWATGLVASAGSLTTTVVESGVLRADANNWKWSSTSKPSKVTFGIVAKTTTKGLEIADTMETIAGINGASVGANLDDTKSFTIDSDTKITYYDYSLQDKNNVRVYASTSMPSVATSRWDTYNVKANGQKTDVIDWKEAVADDAEPTFALVKEVDGDVTEVIFFIK